MSTSSTVANKLQNRIEWIDNAKFIGIFLVVLGHTALPGSLINIIYSFHMPLFFFVSGYLFKKAKYNSFAAFVKQRAKQLLIPYFAFGIITYIFWFFVGRKFANYAPVDPLTPLIGMLHGTDANNYLIHCGSLWFLPCLFLVEVIYFVVAETINKYFLLIILAALGYTNLWLQHVMLPWSFDVALVAILFYAIGNVFKDQVAVLTIMSSSLKALGAFGTLGLLLLLCRFNGRVDMSSNTYPNYVLFVATALTGITSTLFFSMAMEAALPKNSILSFFAKGTLTILAFHAIVGSIIKGISVKLMHVDMAIFQNAWGSNTVLSILTFVALIPIILVIDRFLPFLLGRSKVQFQP